MEFHSSKDSFMSNLTKAEKAQLLKTKLLETNLTTSKLSELMCIPTRTIYGWSSKSVATKVPCIVFQFIELYRENKVMRELLKGKL